MLKKNKQKNPERHWPKLLINTSTDEPMHGVWVPIAYAISEVSGEPAPKRGLARAFTVLSHTHTHIWDVGERPCQSYGI